MYKKKKIIFSLRPRKFRILEILVEIQPLVQAHPPRNSIHFRSFDRSANSGRFLTPSSPTPPLNPIQTFPNFPYEFKWKLLPRPGRFTQFPVALLEAELPLRRRRRRCHRRSPPPPPISLSTCILHWQPVPRRVSMLLESPRGMTRRAPAGPGSSVCMHTGAG